MKTKYPDRELIRRLRGKFIASGLDSMTRQEVLDLINHQHEYIAELEARRKTFSETLGHAITVDQAVEILDGLGFRGKTPKISRAALLRTHWYKGGAAGATFKEIAAEAGLYISTVQNQHTTILRRLREYLEGQPPPTPAEAAGVGG